MALDKAAIEMVFPIAKQQAFAGDPGPTGQRTTVAGGEQGQGPTLRAKGLQRLAAHQGCQVVGQYWALAHGIHAVVRAAAQAGAVTDRADPRMGGALQLRIDLDKTLGVAGEAAACQPYGI